MEKEFEALESLKNMAYSDLDSIPKTAIPICEKSNEEVMKNYEILKQTLTELEQIKEAKPSEARECSLNLYRMVSSAGNGKGFNLNTAWNYHTTIKNYILKAQEQEKVLEIIKNKIIWVENGKLMCGRYADTEIELEEDDFENSGEFNLLNRWSEK